MNVPHFSKYGTDVGRERMHDDVVKEREERVRVEPAFHLLVQTVHAVGVWR